MSGVGRLCAFLLLLTNSQLVVKAKESGVSGDTTGIYSAIDVATAISILRNVGLKTDFLCRDDLPALEPIATFPHCHGLYTNMNRFEMSTNATAAITTEEEEEEEIGNGVMALICVIVAALAAGLTMGLLSLDILDLRIKANAGSSPLQKSQAESLIPLVQDHHRLLVSLLLMNSIANEALPLFLNAVVPGYAAVLLSVTLVLFFGEIIPSAIFSGPNKISIASKLVPLVRLVMCLLAPLSIPIAKLLDRFLRDDEDDEFAMLKYDRNELSALVRIQYEERMACKRRRELALASLEDFTFSSQGSSPESRTDLENGRQPHRSETFYSRIGAKTTSRKKSPRSSAILTRDDSMDIDEVNMVEGALRMKSKTVWNIMTSLRNVYAIPSDTILNLENIVEMYRRGHSRIPVYTLTKKDNENVEDKSSICGVLFTRQLMVLNPEEARPLSTFPMHKPHCVAPTINILQLLTIFQSKRTANKGGHLAIVCASPEIANEALSQHEPIPESAGVLGVVTLEDVLEELIQQEIFDESDFREKHALKRIQDAAKKWKRFTDTKKSAREAELVANTSHTIV